MIVSLPELKVHLRVDHDEEDFDIQGYGQAASLQIQHWLGRKVYAREGDMPVPPSAEFDPHQMVADDAIKVAIKQMVARFYAQRSGEDGTTEDAVPPLSVRALLAGYRVFCPTPYVPEEQSDASGG